MSFNTSRENATVFTIFLPLSKTQGILELTYNTTTGWSHQFVAISSIDCNILSTQKLGEVYFTACVDPEGKLIMYRLILENINLDEYAATKLHSRTSIDIAGISFSNIVAYHDQESRSFDRFYVAVERRIYSVDPTDERKEELTDLLPSEHCPRLHYAGNYMLLASCSDGYDSVYYSLYDERVENTTLSTGLLSFPCPQQDVSLEVNISTNTLLYHDGSSRLVTEFELQSSIYSGVCLTSSPLFVYSSEEQVVYALNVSRNTQETVLLESNACDGAGCDPIVVLEEYLLIQRQSSNGQINTQIRDAGQNYSAKFQVYYGTIGFALVNYQRDKNIEPTDPDTDSVNSTVYVIVGVFIVLALCIGFGITACVVVGLACSNNRYVQKITFIARDYTLIIHIPLCIQIATAPSPL